MRHIRFKSVALNLITRGKTGAENILYYYNTILRNGGVILHHRALLPGFPVGPGKVLHPTENRLEADDP